MPGPDTRCEVSAPRSELVVLALRDPDIRRDIDADPGRGCVRIEGKSAAYEGTTFGYYLFRRCEANLGDMPEPWEQI